MKTKTITEPPGPFQDLLGVPRRKSWTVKLTPTELATLQAARDICERINDAGKKHYGEDDFYEVDDNWSRAEHGLTGLLEFGDGPEGEYHYPTE